MRLIDGDELMEILTTAIRNIKGMAKFLSAEDDPEIQMEIKAYTDIANGVRDMPTIEPGLKWLPVTESVPKDRKIYLVTLDNNTTDFCMWNGSRWGFYGNHGWSECDEVIAWMPLPEPYKEGEG